MTGRTAFEKIWQAHLIADLGEGTGLIAIDRVMLHERTGGVALNSLREKHRDVAMPAQVFATMDHVVDTFPGRTDRTTMPTGTQFITATREAALAAGISLFDLGDPRQGIVHVISPEMGIVLPGVTLVCPDSHTCSQGALGALAWGIGSTEAEHALATTTLRVRKPKTMRVTVSGKLGIGVTAKDLALHMLARFGSAGAKGHVVEYAGEAVAALDIEARLTLCNMATEFSAFSAFIAADEKTFAYLQGRAFAPTGAAWDAAVADWRTMTSDADAAFDVELYVDAADIAPMVSWGTSPQQAIPLDRAVPRTDELSAVEAPEAHARALDYMGLEQGAAVSGLAIDAAFIGSCTNSRLSDLRRAADILRGRTVAAGVKAICVPGSSQVKAAAEAEGIDAVFRAAGFEWREAGCSMCFFAGGESFGAQERVISSTNRNFESRQGPGTRTHLASPETVAASAIAGRITDPRMLDPLP
ncbi:3-isopropylmalate dehydratase large subunit [Sphingomonas crocodyli]|uniref:3-isopropylmalate dehydratase n=1 Tax=Sphingomonas crocodyli TaxID=1979270 RepID=A0A437M089_9SPHN|nr:3-isopropylmalate dehydratase large subunit [Sphingomonas crocodyli]RVT90995.1 3-isopropylmalate dehydratase large subunit [Sphingomonas crocodyli]